MAPGSAAMERQAGPVRRIAHTARSKARGEAGVMGSAVPHPPPPPAPPSVALSSARGPEGAPLGSTSRPPSVTACPGPQPSCAPAPAPPPLLARRLTPPPFGPIPHLLPVPLHEFLWGRQAGWAGRVGRRGGQAGWAGRWGGRQAGRARCGCFIQRLCMCVRGREGRRMRAGRVECGGLHSAPGLGLGPCAQAPQLRPEARRRGCPTGRGGRMLDMGTGNWKLQDKTWKVLRCCDVMSFKQLRIPNTSGRCMRSQRNPEGAGAAAGLTH